MVYIHQSIRDTSNGRRRRGHDQRYHPRLRVCYCCSVATGRVLARRLSGLFPSIPSQGASCYDRESASSMTARGPPSGAFLFARKAKNNKADLHGFRSGGLWAAVFVCNRRRALRGISSRAVGSPAPCRSAMSTVWSRKSLWIGLSSYRCSATSNLAQSPAQPQSAKRRPGFSGPSRNNVGFRPALIDRETVVTIGAVRRLRRIHRA